MANKQIVFTDRLVGISIQNGLVRMDFAVAAGQTKDKDGKAAQRMEVTTQLVMPIEAFAASVAVQDKLVKQLVTVAKKRAAKAGAKSAEGAAGQVQAPAANA
jgi:hypothetical protein